MTEEATDQAQEQETAMHLGDVFRCVTEARRASGSQHIWLEKLQRATAGVCMAGDYSTASLRCRELAEIELPALIARVWLHDHPGERPRSSTFNAALPDHPWQRHLIQVHTAELRALWALLKRHEREGNAAGRCAFDCRCGLDNPAGPARAHTRTLPDPDKVLADCHDLTGELALDRARA